MTELPPPDQPYLAYETPANEPPKGLAMASMICGICSIPLLGCAWFLAIPTAIVAVILGFVARGRVSRREAEGKGMALAGIICGFSSLALAALLIAGVVTFFVLAKSHPSWTGRPAVPATMSTSFSYHTRTWPPTTAPVTAPTPPVAPTTHPQ